MSYCNFFFQVLCFFLQHYWLNSAQQQPWNLSDLVKLIVRFTTPKRRANNPPPSAQLSSKSDYLLQLNCTGEHFSQQLLLTLMHDCCAAWHQADCNTEIHQPFHSVTLVPTWEPARGAGSCTANTRGSFEVTKGALKVFIILPFHWHFLGFTKTFHINATKKDRRFLNLLGITWFSSNQKMQ